mmetsp:Transcript_34906/g.111533  ORF Transcript_34906/g.111533 Transcript_34906/m.111533 type:complete len:329 (-) Transcript_34906:413-1399(-)
MPPRAARLDPRDAYRSRTPPLPHRSRRAMHPRSGRERLFPPGPRTACLLPLAGTAAAIEEAARRVLADMKLLLLIVGCPTTALAFAGGLLMEESELAMPGYATDTDIQTTPWAESSDVGGCSLPGGFPYKPYALALGDMPALGKLVFKNNYCGLVLEVDCPQGKPVKAVVASVKDHYSYATGTDLVWDAWDAAELGDGGDGNPQGEYTNCKVTLTDEHLLTTVDPVCAQRPDSISGASNYYRSVGMFNNPVPVVSATLAGIAGKFSGDSAYFDFGPTGQPVLKMDADFTVTYADGSTITKKLGDCGSSSSVHIFGLGHNVGFDFNVVE